MSIELHPRSTTPEPLLYSADAECNAVARTASAAEQRNLILKDQLSV